MEATKTIQSKMKQISQKAKDLNLDLAGLLQIDKKEDIWVTVQGILPKKPTGLQHQRKIRKEWI